MTKQPKWFKSSWSGDSAACVEVASVNEIILIRNSKDPDGPVLKIPMAAWMEFICGVKKGQFDE